MEINYDLLRPFDLEASKPGAPAHLVGRNIPLTYVAGPDSAGKYIFTVSDGRFARPESCDLERLRMAPLAWLEGRPVYKGDHLYSSFFGKMFVVGGVTSSDGDYLTAPEISDQANTDIKCCTWEAPKPKTEKVRLLAWYDTTTLRLVLAHEGAAVSGCWCRVPGEDKEVEVEL